MSSDSLSAVLLLCNESKSCKIELGSVVVGVSVLDGINMGFAYHPAQQEQAAILQGRCALCRVTHSTLEQPADINLRMM